MGQLGHQGLKKEMCGGRFKLNVKTGLRRYEVDAFIAAATYDLAKRLKIDWDWHRTPQGEISKNLGEIHVRHHNVAKAKFSCPCPWSEESQTTSSTRGTMGRQS